MSLLESVRANGVEPEGAARCQVPFAALPYTGRCVSGGANRRAVGDLASGGYGTSLQFLDYRLGIALGGAEMIKAALEAASNQVSSPVQRPGEEALGLQT